MFFDWMERNGSPVSETGEDFYRHVPFRRAALEALFTNRSMGHATGQAPSIKSRSFSGRRHPTKTVAQASLCLLQPNPSPIPHMYINISHISCVWRLAFVNEWNFETASWQRKFWERCLCCEEGATWNRVRYVRLFSDRYCAQNVLREGKYRTKHKTELISSVWIHKL